MVKFGRWTIVASAEPSLHGNKRALCVCDCGVERTLHLHKVKSGATKSCGCLRDEMSRARVRHGHARKGATSPEYWVLASMKSRCYLPHHPEFKNYGGRGITVCDRWRFGENGVPAFECFFADMGPRPSKGHSIDRYPDNDGNYEPGNCRWATSLEQNRNRGDNRLVQIKGETLPLSAAIEKYGSAKPKTITQRLNHGYGAEEALLTPAFGISRLPHNRLLTEDQVRSIFFDARHHRTIAAEHGVSSGAVFDIKAGRSWAYLGLTHQRAKAGGRQ